MNDTIKQFVQLVFQVWSERQDFGLFWSLFFNRGRCGLWRESEAILLQLGWSLDLYSGVTGTTNSSTSDIRYTSYISTRKGKSNERVNHTNIVEDHIHRFYIFWITYFSNFLFILHHTNSYYFPLFSQNKANNCSNKIYATTVTWVTKSTMPVKHIHNIDEFNELMKSSGLVVVDFTASWCTLMIYIDATTVVVTTYVEEAFSQLLPYVIIFYL